MNEIEVRNGLESLDTKALKQELLDVLAGTAEKIRRAAMIVGILESRGEDLSDFKTGIIGYLRKIACGQLLPEVMVKFFGSRAIKAIASLPIPDQQACIDRENVDVGLIIDGKIDVKSRPIVLLEPVEVRQVFASDHIRTTNEQVAWMRTQDMKRPQVTSFIESSPWVIAGKQIIIHKPMKLTRRDLETMLKATA